MENIQNRNAGGGFFRVSLPPCKERWHCVTMDLHLALVDYLEKGEIATAVTILKADIENLLLPAVAPIQLIRTVNK